MIRTAFILSLWLPLAAFSKPFIVENGKPNAVIVIAENPSRSTRWAARELQETLAKISGARLPIADRPGPGVALYVGESAHTKRLGIKADGLKHGAYRMVSGEDWLALIGDDTEFEPREPWAKNNSERRKLQPLWEEASGLPYGVPNGGMYKNRRLMPKDLAREEREYFWGFDERGSYNAVCGIEIRINLSAHQREFPRINLWLP